MEKKKILITVKTYPTPANKYIETVCTAGLTESGEWIRLYPIRFRMLDEEKQFKKFDWIEVEVEKRSINKDRRPESYICNSDSIRIIGHLDTGGGHWPLRRTVCLKNVYTSMDKLLIDSDPVGPCKSLATFKPSRILDFTVREIDTKELDSKKIAIENNLRDQHDMFETDIPLYWKFARSIPFRFGYRFLDSNRKEYDSLLEDWEIAALFLKYAHDQTRAVEQIRKKYYDDFALQKEVYFFVGTRLKHHLKRYPNYFSIIGVFPPAYEPANQQLPLVFSSI
jgi:hypothetical protein